jgi:hypothetical protein
LGPGEETGREGLENMIFSLLAIFTKKRNPTNGSKKRNSLEAVA